LRPDGIRGVVLDLDDTLTDLSSFELEVWDDVAKLIAARLPHVDLDELRERYSAAMDGNYQRVLTGELDMRGYRRARLEAALEPWSELDDDLFEAYFAVKQRLVDQTPAKAGSYETLRALRAAGLRLAILTNGPSDLQRGKLERHGFPPLVDAVGISEEIGAAKPDRAAFDAVAAMLGLLPGELAMVGDNWTADIEGALDAGFVRAYYVGAPAPPRERAGVHVLASAVELPAALGL
jgi:HAD superfamily hydrolase (TIGR01549 family)